MDPTLIITIGTPILVPLIIAGVKKILPKLPTWTLPVMAPVLGSLVTIIANLSVQYGGNVWIAALLGLAGVGVREIVDQLKPVPDPDKIK